MPLDKTLHGGVLPRTLRGFPEMADVDMQVRVCTRMGVQLLSTDFKSPEYYSNIRKAITAGYFMQARASVRTSLRTHRLDPLASS